MGRNDKYAVTSESIAVGIKGDRHSLCGAIKRFELHGPQWNGSLSLREQCARRIALIRNEQLKCFILGYLSSNLFQYVTKDIFNLQRDEFISSCAKPFYMCQECTMDTYEKPMNCRCPQMSDAIDALNKSFSKRLNDEDEEIDESKEFRLSYKIPNDGLDHSDELNRPTSFFLYLSPVDYRHRSGLDSGTFAKYHLIPSQISAADKLLFVDAMRYFGAFRSEYEEPQIIFYRRREFCL